MGFGAGSSSSQSSGSVSNVKILTSVGRTPANFTNRSLAGYTTNAATSTGITSLTWTPATGKTAYLFSITASAHLAASKLPSNAQLQIKFNGSIVAVYTVAGCQTIEFLCPIVIGLGDGAKVAQVDMLTTNAANTDLQISYEAYEG
jgi:hypothetical protein